MDDCSHRRACRSTSLMGPKPCSLCWSRKSSGWQSRSRRPGCGALAWHSSAGRVRDGRPGMPVWDGYPIRTVSRQLSAPAWVDNDVDLLALAELRTNSRQSHRRPAVRNDRSRFGRRPRLRWSRTPGPTAARGHRRRARRRGRPRDLSLWQGRLPDRGFGAAALARQARELAETGASPMLGEILAASGSLTVADAILAAERGDPAARTMLARSRPIRRPHLGHARQLLQPWPRGPGQRRGGGDDVLHAIRETVEQQSLHRSRRAPCAERSAMGDDAGLLGAIHLTLEALFSEECVVRWRRTHRPVTQRSWLCTPAFRHGGG